MQIKQISTKQQPKTSQRLTTFDSFIGQQASKSLLQKAIDSAKQRETAVGHILLAGPSGYGKTTLAHIIANTMNTKFHAITGYAISKPAEIISLLNTLQEGDILFIDEIHRLHPKIEEVLYIAMEDFVIDMIMPDGSNIKVPLQPFTLIGATTKLESLSEPLKNRFIYTCHFHSYTDQEKLTLVKFYMDKYVADYDNTLIPHISQKVDTTPRNINNLCIKVRDFLLSHKAKKLTDTLRAQCAVWLDIDDGGITSLHRRYLSLLSKAQKPVGLKTLAVQLDLHEQSLEQDVEPLLMKLGKIEKTPKGRVLVE